jgi:hypothetical protein
MQSLILQRKSSVSCILKSYVISKQQWMLSLLPFKTSLQTLRLTLQKGKWGGERNKQKEKKNKK